MRITSLKIYRDSVLGDIDIDFLLENGNSAERVFVAGDNGVGKTVLLETIERLIEMTPMIDKPGSNSRYEMTILLDDEDFQNLVKIPLIKEKAEVDHKKPTKVVDLVYDLSKGSAWEHLHFFINFESGGSIDIPVRQLVRTDFYSSLKSVYSPASMNFGSVNIASTTALGLDKELLPKKNQPPENLSHEIKQLLIDIDSEDSRSVKEAVNELEDGKKYLKEELYKESSQKIPRFKKAFEQMFQSKEYSGIRRLANNTFDVIFTENGREMSIDQLSSGEKQIVFRGSFLLRNINTIGSSIVMIDEPEISMHPDWQFKIANFYSQMFVKDDVKLENQLIFATHSPFVLDSIDASRDKVIILEKEASGKISLGNSFYTWGEKKRITGLIFPDSKPKLLTEGPTDVQYLILAAEKLGKGAMFDKLDIDHCGTVNEGGNIMDSGESGMKKLYKSHKKTETLLRNSLILLFDPEVEGLSEYPDYGNVHVLICPKNLNNNLLDKGIESLLQVETLKNGVDLGYVEHTTKVCNDNSVESLSVKNKCKKDFCNYVSTLETETYEGFTETLDLLENQIKSVFS